MLVVLFLIALSITPLVDTLTFHWFTRDLDLRGKLISNAVHDSLARRLALGEKSKIVSLLTKITLDDRLMAAGYCSSDGILQYKTELFPKEIKCLNPEFEIKPSKVMKLKSGDIHITKNLLMVKDRLLGHIFLIHDMSFIEKRSQETKWYVRIFFILLGIIISILTVMIAQWSWRGWIGAMRTLLTGEGIFKPSFEMTSSEVKPLVKDLRALIKELQTNQRIRDESLISWTPKVLKEILNKELSGDEIIIVSNREPYIHNRTKEGNIEVQHPASGLVTALEPVMKTCSGTWIAHGNGNADREFVDEKNHLKVPLDDPKYILRRVWLTKEEEEGYYYGFSNEGLWPLCHIAHTRPTFRSQDWEQYVRVNKKFSEVVLSEVKSKDPIILIQDYHFALLPKLIRDKLPDAIIITFWHIPWPNPEAFGICPWKEEILEGLLGSTIVGFHIQFHCNNFIETIDRFLECRIDKEHSTISFLEKMTAVKAYPISIEWPPHWLDLQKPIQECCHKIRSLNGLSNKTLVGLGIERLDYTKGIIERFLAVERLLEQHPEWLGKFSFIQIAAPSRSRIETYRHLQEDVKKASERINKKFNSSQNPPIILKIEHHEPSQIFEYYRGSDLCFVNSLHDGMNLVAKEFISARNDEQGVLILSHFTGASRELPEAIIVNPYDIDESADALHAALSMHPFEQRERMRSMRSYVQEYNVFRWAGRMLIDASRVRQRNRILQRLATMAIRRGEKEFWKANIDEALFHSSRTSKT
ncbi:MAG: trehalose-6-phosphate synthase [Deltaproteobacteria bacterium GWA2_38_16]|nr:MAG: trehalose-6-phosphate synthase [Deltaproteobacteria bacterium GWA2_38_16]OGQ03867.1 MAG: trehalose-6-phosphate synthase [Deltaproteobacteria bacterium RIFCSPHIGHO2_02_FULL_38_15]OGQ33333.1 MAG: trehalose-6-phosphate synthase [Deltaproteobacteria bacterium RIFCSPLOWO2_01_FULL_38_9]